MGGLRRALQLVRRLALEALQLGDIQRGVLLNQQSVAADVDPVQRRRRFLEIVPAPEYFGQHDLGVGIVRMQGDGLLQPCLRIVQPVGEQCDAAQLDDGRAVLGILSRYVRVDFAGFRELPTLEKLIGGDFRRLGCGRPRQCARRDNDGE